jgi:hypothetical protein
MLPDIEKPGRSDEIERFGRIHEKLRVLQRELEGFLNGP